MEKRVFRSKIVYWITIFFFILGGTFFVPSNTQPFSYNFGTLHTIFVALMFVFAIIILVSLFNKEKYSTKLINIYIVTVLIINLKSLLYILLGGKFDYNN